MLMDGLDDDESGCIGGSFRARSGYESSSVDGTDGGYGGMRRICVRRKGVVNGRSLYVCVDDKDQEAAFIVDFWIMEETVDCVRRKGCW